MTATEYKKFAAEVAARVPKNAATADQCGSHLRLSLTWTVMHLQSGTSPNCELLLKGSYGAAVEAVSLIAFGLVRPAILSLRSHYELSLQFLFYKDHPVEWRNVENYRTQPNLPGVNKKYFKDNYSSYEDRLKKLTAVKSGSKDDCYSVLSGVAHGTAINSISTATEPKALIEDSTVVSQSSGVFLDVAESISDIYIACFESNWLSIPELVKQNLKSRFGTKSPSTELEM